MDHLLVLSRFVPNSHASCFPGSGARSKDSPIRNVLTPPLSSMFTSDGVPMPLSLTITVSGGNEFAKFRVCFKQVLNVRRSRLLIPTSGALSALTVGTLSGE